MPDMALFYSILFFIVFLIYFFFAVYILHLNERAWLNRVFYAVCISLCFWSFGFAMSVNAQDAASALLWKRVAAIGWATIYANILLFILILTGHGKLLRKWWFYPLFFAPALLNFLIFSILPTTVSIEYHMIRVSYGWATTAGTDIWNILFYLYYIGYIAACLVVVWVWKRKSKYQGIGRQANLLFLSFILAFILGSATDVILATAKEPVVPQLAPVIILIPISVFYYLIRKFGLMNSETLRSNQVIIDDKAQSRLYVYLSVFYMVVGLLSFFLNVNYRQQSNLLSAVLSSGVLLVVGLSIFLIQHIKGEALRYTLNLLAILVSIPLVSVPFSIYGNITAWAFSVILIIFSLVYTKRAMLISVTIDAIITQILIWLYLPKQTGGLTTFELFSRIAFFAVLFLIGYYINRIFASKLKENTYQIELQKLISDISYDFARITKANLDDNINRMLEETGRFFNADRSYIFLCDQERSLMNLSYEWCRDGSMAEMGLVDPFPIASFPEWMDDMKNHVVEYREDVTKLAKDFIGRNDLFHNKNIVSLVSIPIAANGTVYGFYGFSSFKDTIKMTGNTLELLQTVANLLSDKFTMVKAESEIEHMAYYDQLTGLPNRLLFHDRAMQAINLAQRKGNFLGIVFMDLDSFKSINDTMGHIGGDEIIREVGATLSRSVRKADTVARFGGDEFLILLNDISDFSQIEKIAGKLMKVFQKSFKFRDQEYYITASAGIAVYPFDGEDCDTLFKNADIAMYRAKARGANQYVLCTVEMKDEVQKNRILTNSLYRALDRGEFIVYYQPQVSLLTGNVIGMEALLRWQHPQLGMIPPAVFIPLAEKNGLINNIGEWVLKSACRQNKLWQKMGLPRFRMAVNMSVLQFRNPKLVETVANVLAETGLEPCDLELEITESAALQETGYIVDSIKKLKQLGVSISIDDFGMEYSSLNRLKELPIDRIKIDMQFIRGIGVSEKDQAITMIIINLAKTLGLQVIAEGVETEPQLQFLKNKECDEVQGYYFYKPMPPEDFTDLISHAVS